MSDLGVSGSCRVRRRTAESPVTSRKSPLRCFHTLGVTDMANETWRPATRRELIKALIHDVKVAIPIYLFFTFGPGLVLGGLSDWGFLGLLASIAVLIGFFWLLCGFAGWWMGDLAVHNFRSHGYRRYHLHQVYGDTGNHVGLGGRILRILLSPIDLTFLCFKTNAAQLFVWARRIQVIYVPPGQPLPKGPLPRPGRFPVEFNPDYFTEE